jgi:hypothetical protein
MHQDFRLRKMKKKYFFKSQRKLFISRFRLSLLSLARKVKHNLHDGRLKGFLRMRRFQRPCVVIPSVSLVSFISIFSFHEEVLEKFMISLIQCLSSRKSCSSLIPWSMELKIFLLVMSDPSLIFWKLKTLLSKWKWCFVLLSQKRENEWTDMKWHDQDKETETLGCRWFLCFKPFFSTSMWHSLHLESFLEISEKFSSESETREVLLSLSSEFLFGRSLMSFSASHFSLLKILSLYFSLFLSVLVWLSMSLSLFGPWVQFRKYKF